MDTRLATNQIRTQEWAQIIKDRCVSGLKVDEYCELHQLSRHAYYYWLRKVKEAALTEAGFVELKAPSAESLPSTSAVEHATNFVPELTLSVSGVLVGVSSSTPMDLLSKTMEVLRNAK